MQRLIFLAALLTIRFSTAQDLDQTVRGTVQDRISGNPVSAVAIAFRQGEKTVGSATTDEEGRFSLRLSPGRYLISYSHVGYQSIVEELLVISGKETQLAVVLTERVTQLGEVNVVATPSVNSAPGGSDITIEKTLRVPANFFDPLRMASSMPGMAAVNDQGNALAVKGYSPNAILWKLEGLDIVNPNHLANAGTLSDKPVSFGGGVSILSSQVLDRTGFHSGWLPTQYGNALSAVVDMGMRKGNQEEHEFTAQASLIGLDVAAEGPLNKKSSYLANYRYSTVGLLSALGLNFGDESINFQDLTFHIDVAQSPKAHLSVFGFGGLSSNRFKRKLPTEWETEKDRYDIDFDGKVFGVGFKERWGNQVKFSWATSVSGQFQDRTSKSANVPYPHVNSEKYFTDQLLVSNHVQARLRTGGGAFEVGALVNYLNSELEVQTITSIGDYANPFFPNATGSVTGLLYQPYIHFSKKWTAPWQVDVGLRYTHFAYNQTASLDPRISIQRHLSAGSISLSYGRASQWQQTQTYIAQNNKNLDLTKADQYLLEFRQHFGYRGKLTVGAYYHQLSNIPVNPTLPVYSAINQWDDFPAADLVSAGSGTNTGFEASYEKTFYNQFYFSANGSMYRSTYKGYGSGELNSRFNGSFTSSFLAGKEWGGTDRSFGIHVRFLYLGGMRHPVIDVLNSTSYGTTVYDNSGYSVKLPDYWRPDLRVSWRKNKPGYTRTLSVDIQNLASRENIAFFYYDTHTATVEAKYQLGIIPVLVYRVDF